MQSTRYGAILGFLCVCVKPTSGACNDLRACGCSTGLMDIVDAVLALWILWMQYWCDGYRGYSTGMMEQNMGLQPNSDLDGDRC